MVKIVLGVCGSIAAVKTVELVREFRRRGVEVEVVMTEAAKKIINPFALEWASGNPVVTKLTGSVEHVRLCGVDGEGSLFLICPATANTISKVANGIDDSSVTTFASTALGSEKPVVMVPAMHISMYKNPFVAGNIEKLKKSGITVVEPKIEENKAKIPEKKELVKLVLSRIK